MEREETIKRAKLDMFWGKMEISLGTAFMVAGALAEQQIITITNHSKLVGFFTLVWGAFTAGAGRWSLNRARAKRDTAVDELSLQNEGHA